MWQGAIHLAQFLADDQAFARVVRRVRGSDEVLKKRTVVTGMYCEGPIWFRFSFDELAEYVEMYLFLIGGSTFGVCCLIVLFFAVKN